MKTYSRIMLIIALALLAVGFVTVARAGEPYLILGIGHVPNAYAADGVQTVPAKSSGEIATLDQIDGPFGRLEIGYRWRQIDVSALHISSITTRKDRGVNFIGVNYRFSMGEP